MAEPDSQGVSVMFFIGYGRTLLEELNENILVIVEIHEVGTTLLEGLDKQVLGIVESHEHVRLWLKYCMKKL